MKNSNKSSFKTMKHTNNGKRPFCSNEAVITHPLLSDEECLIIQKAVLKANKNASTKEQVLQVGRFAEAVMMANSLAMADKINMEYMPDSKEWKFNLKPKKAH